MYRESTRSVLVETTTSNALILCDALGNYDWSDQAEEGPTNFALMAYSSISSNSEVSTDSNCSSSCLESLEARLLVYKKNESVYEEDIKLLKRLGYNAVPPPYTGNFLPPKHDLSLPGIEEFINEPIVKKSVVETSEAKDSVDKPKGNPQMDLQEQGVIDSGCSRHMTGNMSYLTDFEEIDRGYVAFGGNPKRGKITGRVPRKNNMYSVDLKNIVPKGGLTCLFAKSTSDESKLWHIRLGHVNFKTMNKLVKENLVIGLPSKLFENDQTCVACQKGKQHKASCKSKTVARTMLADSKLPTTFWAKAVNTACYVQNRVLVTKPHNKTPYELFLGRKPTLGFMRPFGCPVTILNTIDHLGKFDGKADEGFFVGYSINSKAFRLFNSRTRIVEENLHVQFSENTSNIAGSRPKWPFDIDALTKSMNYKPVVAGNQSNGNAGIKACDDVGKASMETVSSKDYILLPLWTADPPFSQSSKSSPNDGSKPSSDDGKKVDENPRKESEFNDQEKENDVNNTNNVNAASTNEVNAIGAKTSIELPDDPNIPALEDIVYSDDDEDVGVEADINNLDAFMPVSPIPTTRIHKDHPVDQIIRDLKSAPQTRRMIKNLEEHEEPKKVIHALKDPSWIEAMHEELL
ncbi:retrovirus-related pol polyprotein from transposon TNT 1-94 [Tanacetum coccineum]